MSLQSKHSMKQNIWVQMQRGADGKRYNEKGWSSRNVSKSQKEMTKREK